MVTCIVLVTVNDLLTNRTLKRNIREDAKLYYPNIYENMVSSRKRICRSDETHRIGGDRVNLCLHRYSMKVSINRSTLNLSTHFRRHDSFLNDNTPRLNKGYKTSINHSETCRYHSSLVQVHQGLIDAIELVPSDAMMSALQNKRWN